RISGKKFIDLDFYIVKKVNLSISEIFKQYGQDKFRIIESQCLKEISDLENCIVSLGGGTVTSAENVQVVKGSGKLVYLYLTFNRCYERIKNNPKRPIVMQTSKDKLYNLYLERHEIYKANADCTFETFRSPIVCAKQILRILK
ncbi:MAG: shikimate kinase, partial [Oscillospiraceae bacterium]